MQRLPLGQIWLIERMRVLGYDANPGGVCFGVANMATQAHLVNDIATFNKRLYLLHSIPVSELNAKITAVRDKVKYLSKVKKSGDEFVLDVESQLTEEEQLILSIPAFFDGIMAHQSPSIFPHLFEQGKAVLNQHALSSYTVSRSKKMEDEGQKIERYMRFSNAYALDDLAVYFSGLAAVLKDLTVPVSFNLESINHAITVRYDNHKHCWLLTNANHMPMQEFFTANDMAEAVNKALLSHNLNTVFSTSIYIEEKNSDIVDDALLEWGMYHDENITRENVNLADAAGYTHLLMAIFYNDLRLVEELLNAGANPKSYKDLKVSPFHYAITNSSCDIIEALLPYIDVNLINTPNKAGCLPLLSALQADNAELVELLLKNGALPVLKPNVKYSTQDELRLLCFGVAKKNETIVATVLKALGDDPGSERSGGLTLLDQVMQLSAADIMELFKKNNQPLKVDTMGDEIASLIDGEISRFDINDKYSIGVRQVLALLKEMVLNNDCKNKYYIDIFNEWKNGKSNFMGLNNIDVIYPNKFSFKEYSIFESQKTETYKFLETLLDKYSDKLPGMISITDLKSKFESMFISIFAGHIVKDKASIEKFVTQWRGKNIAPLIRVHSNVNLHKINESVSEVLDKCIHIKHGDILVGLELSPLFDYVKGQLESKHQFSSLILK